MKKIPIIVFCLGALAASQAANATPIANVSYNLTSNHCTTQAACGAPGTVFGVVTLTQSGSNVDFVVDLNSPPYVWAQTGSADFMLFKFNGTGIVVGDISVTQTFAGETLAGAAGAFNGDGTGTFGFAIECTTCDNGIQTISSNIVFSVANATIAELTVPNPDGNVFVADIGNSTNGATGPIDATVPNGVPDGGSTVALLGSALLGLGILRRRFAKN